MARRAPLRREKGVILILALMIVALVTTVVVSVSWRFNLSMARNENRWHGAVARAYLEGGEQLAALILREDFRQTRELDHLAEEWAEPQTLPTDEGFIRGEIEDAQGRFNLNSLLPPPPVVTPPGQQPQPPSPSPWARFSEPQLRFIRFLQTIELETGAIELNQAVEIVEAIQDWLDADDTPTGFGGAEASYYESLDPPVLIANGPMTSVSELSLVKGVTPELYQRLLPYVMVLPGNVPLNINTLKPELLRGFNRKEVMEPLMQEDWQALVDERASLEFGYQNVQEFVTSPVVTAILGNEQQFDGTGLATHSYYFIFRAETLVSEQIRRSQSLLFREGENVRVVRRTDAHL